MHSLRSNASQIGALELAEQAAVLEPLCGAGERLDARQLQRMKVLLDAMLWAIDGSLPALRGKTLEPAQPGEHLDRRLLVKHVDRLGQLRTLLQDDNVQAIDVVGKLDEECGGKVSNSRLQRVIASVQDYDFEAALSQLEEIVRELVEA